LGFEEIITYGNGVLLMFFGPSGTGKTMMANALGNHLGKKILLINYTSLGGGIMPFCVVPILSITDPYPFPPPTPTPHLYQNYIRYGR